MLETCTRYFQINRRDLVYLKFILEAYEGMSTLSTADRERSIVRLNMPVGFRDDVAALINALSTEIEIREVEPPRVITAETTAHPCREVMDHA